jgi:hypothetical protein
MVTRRSARATGGGEVLSGGPIIGGLPKWHGLPGHGSRKARARSAMPHSASCGSLAQAEPALSAANWSARTTGVPVPPDDTPKNRENEGGSHDLIDNKGSVLGTHDVDENK